MTSLVTQNGERFLNPRLQYLMGISLHLPFIRSQVIHYPPRLSSPISTIQSLLRSHTLLKYSRVTASMLLYQTQTENCCHLSTVFNTLISPPTTKRPPLMSLQPSPLGLTTSNPFYLNSCCPKANEISFIRISHHSSSGYSFTRNCSPLLGKLILREQCLPPARYFQGSCCRPVLDTTTWLPPLGHSTSPVLGPSWTSLGHSAGSLGDCLD